MTSPAAWLNLAFRNLLRNKRRSVVTILAATLGFAAVNVFAGFTNYMFVNLRDAFIYSGGNGHIQIFKKGYEERGQSDPFGYLLPAETYSKLTKLAAEDERIVMAAGRMQLTGQIDTGTAYNIFIGSSMQPSHHKTFFQESKTLKRGFSFVAEGEPLTDEVPFEIGITFGVRDNLNLEIGDDAVLMSRTVDGQINVVDAIVKNYFAASNASLDDKLIVMPLELAQDLYQTDAVGSVSILLHHRSDIPAVEKRIREVLAAEIADLKIVRWDEQSQMYRLTRKMFDMIFGMVFFILIVIVTMSVMNTMGMAILERTTEIGTLRALGLKRRGIVTLFGIEGALLGLLGSCFGVLISVAVWALVRWQNPMWTPPTVGREVPLEIRVTPQYLVMTSVFLVVLTLVAAIVPARRAAHQGIVEALGHV